MIGGRGGKTSSAGAGRTKEAEGKEAEGKEAEGTGVLFAVGTGPGIGRVNQGTGVPAGDGAAGPETTTKGTAGGETTEAAGAAKTGGAEAPKTEGSEPEKKERAGPKPRTGDSTGSGPKNEASLWEPKIVNGTSSPLYAVGTSANSEERRAVRLATSTAKKAITARW